MPLFQKAQPKHCARCGKILNNEQFAVCAECRPYRVVEAAWDKLEKTTNEIALEGWDLCSVAASPVTSWIRGGPTYQLFFKRRQGARPGGT
jgi:hypothetical protein